MSKILTPMALALSLCVFTFPCLSMEEENGKDNAVSHPEPNTHEGTNQQVVDTDKLFKDWEAIIILTEAAKLQSEELPKLRKERKKADLLRDIIEKITRALSLVSDINGDFYKRNLQYKANCLKDRGHFLLLCHPTIEASPTSVSDFRTAQAHLQESCQILERQLNQNLLENAQQSCKHSLILLSYACIYLAHVETDPQAVLTLCDESLRSIYRHQHLFPGELDYEIHKNFLDISLQKFVGVFDGVCAEYDTLCQGNLTDNGLTNRFMGVSRMAKRILDLMATHFDSKRLREIGIRVRIPTDAITTQLNSRLTKLFQTLPSRMDPAIFVQLPQATYCGALKGASLACANQTIFSGLDASQQSRLREGFQKQSMDLLNEAIAVYRRYFYHGEYENNADRGSLYIIAALDDLMGNPIPLNDFYKMVREEKKNQRRQRMVEEIKESQRFQLEEQAKRDEAKREREMQIQNQSVPQISLPSSNPRNSYSPFEFARPNERTSPRALHFEARVKTRGAALLGPQLGEVEPYVDVVLLEEERVIRVLSPEDYDVFCHLTRTGLNGKKPNNHISRDQVIRLLKSLKCCVEPGGSHFKATDPRTSAVWTIPPAWDGPIHSAYRRQLNEFLQNLMEIDPVDVVLKGNEAAQNSDRGKEEDT
ncbi:MAG: hypothetical protein K2Y18_04400 [Alphaproteobacteria bacterium]|jgi:hypothetical protein|nr:hypothetical protein [Alphaproteobacteria bacterium]